MYAPCRGYLDLFHCLLQRGRPASTLYFVVLIARVTPARPRTAKPSRRKRSADSQLATAATRSLQPPSCPLSERRRPGRPTHHFGLWTLEELFRGNGVTLRTQKVIQGGDNGHVGRPCQVSPAPPCPELFCELRGLCRHSYFGPRTCGRSVKPRSSKWRGPNPGFQRNLSPP